MQRSGEEEREGEGEERRSVPLPIPQARPEWDRSPNAALCKMVRNGCVCAWCRFARFVPRWKTVSADEVDRG